MLSRSTHSNSYYWFVFSKKNTSFLRVHTEPKIKFLQIFRKSLLENVLEMLQTDFHQASITRNMIDDVPKLGYYFLMGFQFIYFCVKKASFWEAPVESQIEFLQIFRKTPLGNVFKMLQTAFNRATISRNMVDDVPKLGYYFLMGFPFIFFGAKKQVFGRLL